MSAKRRGRETALDMIRTLVIVFAVVFPLWFFGQASPSDSKAIRPVDPASALKGFAQDTGAPVPTTPEGWVVNVATGSPGTVRVGYVIGDDYTEFVGGRGPTYLADVTGKGQDKGPVDVNGVVWRDYVSADGHQSLVRVVKGVTLVVGGIREDVTLEQLKTLAATVR